MKKLLTFLTLLTLFFGVGWAETVSNELTRAITGVTTGTYTDWTYAFSNGVSYSGNSAGGTSNNPSIQLRSKNNESGIVSTTTIGSIKKVVVTWNSSTVDGRTLDIYGKNSAYDTPSDLYGITTTQGTKLGSIEKGASTELNVSGSYAYIGIRSNDGALYLDKIIIYWETGGTTVETVATPTFDPTGGTFTSAQNVTISCATSGATIHYTTDGSTPTASSTTYSSAIPVSETTTIKAIAMKSGMNNSAVASATYTIEIPSTDEYELVTNASQLSAGDQIIIANTATAGSGYALSTSGTNNRTGTTVTIANSKITPSSSVQILTLEKEGDNWLFNTGSGYLYAASSTANQLKTETTADANAQATISISSNAATIDFQGTNTRNRIRYNPNNGSPIFSCYASSSTTGNLPYIYKKATSTTSDKLYLIGNGMNSQSGWNISTGPEFSYNSTAGTYAVDAYFDMADRCYFQFVEGLSDSNSNWGGLTGRYYATSNDGDVAVDNYDMDGTVPLYFTNSTNYSPGQYAFSVPAGIYTIVVDKTNWQIYVTQHPAIVSINDHTSSSFTEYFTGSTTATLASNLTELGGKIYYTTDDSDPLTSSTRQEYSEPFTITTNTTVKACAEFNYIKTDVVSMSFIKTPVAPVISPASCTFNEPLTVSITAEEGATIYYTTDGTDPRNSETRIEYTGSFAVSTTTTVKARAFFGENYGQMAEATYTYSNVQPSTGDFVLVTSADQLVAGNEYIIMSYDNDNDYAMGSISNTRGYPVTDFTLNGTIGVSGSTVSAGTTVNVLTLGGTTGALTLQQSDNKYIVTAASGTSIDTDGSACNLVITIGSDNAANIQNSATTDTRQIRYATAGYFRNYGTSQANTNDVYLYTRASNAVQNPVFSPIAGLYDVDVDVTISCATDGATIYYTDDNSDPKTSTTRKEYTGEIVVSASTTFKAVAVKGENSSNVVTAEYIIQKETDIETVTLTYSEPFTSGIGKFRVDNVSGFSPVWSLDGNYGIKGTSFEPATKINHAAVSRLVSPIIDMTGAVQPELTFSYQINSYFTNPANQCQLFIRETTDGTDGTWVQLPMSFVIPAQNQWSNDFVDMPLLDYAGKKVQISFLYTNPTEGTGAGTWEIQNFVVADNSEYRMVNNIAEFLALDNGTKAKFKNPVTVLYDYAQSSDGSLQEYIWVKDESGFMQFYMHPTLNTTNTQQAFYENGDIIPAGFVVVKNYYEYGSYIQAYSDDALNAGFLPATQKGLADPDYYDFDFLNTLSPTDVATVAEHCNRYITLENIRIASKNGNNFTFSNANGTVVNACVGFNKFSNNGSLKKDGTSAVVTVPNAGITTYNVKAILQLWKGNNNDIKWEILPIEITEWKEEEVTLRKLCAEGSKNNSYKISNNLLGVYSYYDEDLNADVLWVKDDNGQSIHMVSPEAPYTDNFAIEFEDIKDGNGNVIIPANPRLDQTQYDQSNWCQLIVTSKNGSDFVGKIINGGSIHGKYIDDLNPTIEGVELTENDIYSVGNYVPNYYIPASFVGSQSCATDMYGEEGHGDFFFMTPKPQEYAMVVWAVWDGQKMKMPTKQQGNSHELFGEFSIDLSMNQFGTSAIPAGVYSFHAIIRKVNTSGAPALKGQGDIQNDQSANYMVYPLDIDPENNPSTAINTVDVNGKTVKSVKYVNVAGMVSDVPFQGVNIVVTEYTDGSRTTTKMLRK